MRRAWVLVSAMAVAALEGACAHGPATVADTSDFSEADAAPRPSIDGGASVDATFPDDVGVADAAPGQEDASAADGTPAPPPDSGEQADAAPMPDAGTCARVGKSATCGVAPQCGCSANETCDLTDTGDSECVGPAGLGVVGNHCVNNAACQIGLTCDYGSSCRPFCTTAGQACGAANLGKCVQLNDANGAAIPKLLVCEINCQMQDPSSCGFGSACFESSVNAGASDCYGTGALALNQTCKYADDCQAGLGCIGSGNNYKCKKWCRVGQNDCGGPTCTGFATAFVVNGVTYGSCP